MPPIRACVDIQLIVNTKHPLDTKQLSFIGGRMKSLMCHPFPVLVGLLLTLSMSGCGLFDDDDDPPIQKPPPELSTAIVNITSVEGLPLAGINATAVQVTGSTTKTVSGTETSDNNGKLTLANLPAKSG